MEPIVHASNSTGMIVSVLSLSSESLCGGGELLDLMGLMDFCSEQGIKDLQLLSVLDSGDSASLHNSICAHAIQPVYVRIEELPEFKGLSSDFASEICEKLRGARKKNLYIDLRLVKLHVLRTIYNSLELDISANSDFGLFCAQNAWLKNYGIFMALKEWHGGSSWRFWREEFRLGSISLVNKLWDHSEFSRGARFYAWVQYRAYEQFAIATGFGKERGLRIKINIPFFMNDDSVDVWALRENFMVDLRAGLPPDELYNQGQNWGFPLYNWDYLQSHEYGWWVERLAWVQPFCDSVLLEYVRGFFGLWAIPSGNNSPVMGFCKPGIYFTNNELLSLGLDEGRIRWLSEPHVIRSYLFELFGNQTEDIMDRCFARIGNEDLYLFKSGIRVEQDLLNLPYSDSEKAQLVRLFKDRSLLRVDDQLYVPSWSYKDCWRFQIMSDVEKQAFIALADTRRLESERLWQFQGQKILQNLKDRVPLIFYAENLGYSPDCLVKTLHQLNIPRLVLPRWARNYQLADQPFICPQDYDPQSLCLSSVFDGQSMAVWWQAETQRDEFWKALGLQAPAPVEYNAETALLTLRAIMCAASISVSLPIQDWLALGGFNDSSSEDLSCEYLMPVSIETMQSNPVFKKIVKDLCTGRTNRILPLGSK